MAKSSTQIRSTARTCSRVSGGMSAGVLIGSSDSSLFPVEQPLDYAPPESSTASRGLRWTAIALAAYPIVPIVLLYAQWLLSWYVLGHRPRMSLDDPKSIDVANAMHGLTGLAFAGLLPFAIVTLTVNMTVAAARPDGIVRTTLRFGVLCAIWFCAIAWLFIDPLTVIGWWVD